MCTARLFSHGGRALGAPILPGQRRTPVTILGIRKLDTGLPDGKDNIHLRSLILTQYWSVTDGQTDSRICIYHIQRLQS